ncbi:metal-dependent phosphohydrolase [Mesorhizobium sp. CN2-181]|uniref:metal-dependent phosphohydrolase n=1 Tax=Mesorhizobium yinganensis TaxID=3157707 RepID=UPI0032B70AD8
MLNIATLAAEALGRNLAETYRHYYGDRHTEFATLLDAGARLLIERIGSSDALYHNFEHTILVTQVGQEIIRGKLLFKSIEPEDWVHFIFSLLCHDIGFVRGACTADGRTSVVIDEAGRRFELPRGASDAILAPFHVTRGKIAVRERFGNHRLLDCGRIARAIELTRFPVPDDQDHKETDTEAGLVRAADLIGQLADPNYPSKLNALFHELQETGSAEKIGVSNAADLVESYPKFFWTAVEPHIGDGLTYLGMTMEGKRWAASLYGNLSMAEHRRLAFGPQLRSL